MGLCLSGVTDDYNGKLTTLSFPLIVVTSMQAGVGRGSVDCELNAGKVDPTLQRALYNVKSSAPLDIRACYLPWWQFPSPFPLTPTVKQK